MKFILKLQFEDSDERHTFLNNQNKASLRSHLNERAHFATYLQWYKRAIQPRVPWLILLQVLVFIYSH